MADPKDDQRELAQLRAALAAIRAGRVDAVVGGDQLLLLRVKELEEARERFLALLSLVHRVGRALLEAAGPKQLLQRACATLAEDGAVQGVAALHHHRLAATGCLPPEQREALAAALANNDPPPCLAEPLADHPPACRVLDPAVLCRGCPLSPHLVPGCRVVRLEFTGGCLVLLAAAELVVGEPATELLGRLAVDLGLALERLELQDRLQRAARLEAIGTLAAGIAHDFNNILTAVIGYAELGRESLPPDSRAAGDLEQVVRAGLRARDLVGQILTFSRAGSGDKRPVLVQPLVKEAVKLLRAAMPPMAALRQEITAGDAHVYADPTHIHQVVMNLGTNAYQALEDGRGTITVALGRLADDDPARSRLRLAPGPWLRLRVADTGRGMEPAVRERIFEPYFSTKGPGQGTGLGLAVVHGIVTDCGGVIDVDSRPGQGSVFDVYLPEVAGVAGGRTTSGQLPTGNGERLLVVDDEEAVVAVVRDHLAGLGYRVDGCPTPAAALERLAADGYDLLITDLAMPAMDGAELLAEARRRRPQLATLVLTGLAGGRRPPAADLVVQKPFTREELAGAVRRVLDQRAGG